MFAQIVAVVAFGVCFAILGPWPLAPVCWAAAAVMYLRRGVTILEIVRDAQVGSPILDIAYPPKREVATAIALPPRGVQRIAAPPR